jgi:hypothetical protein
MSRLFQPFFTHGKPRGQPGMSIARKIVESTAAR